MIIIRNRTPDSGIVRKHEKRQSHKSPAFFIFCRDSGSLTPSALFKSKHNHPALRGSIFEGAEYTYSGWGVSCTLSASNPFLTIR
jgi:hypothetical protein